MKAQKYKYHFNNFDEKAISCGGISLYQYGEMLCNPTTFIPDHSQYCYEFTYVISGAGEVTVGDTVFSVRENDCIISFPQENHKILSDSKDPLRFAFIGFVPNPADNSFFYLFEEMERIFGPQNTRQIKCENQVNLIFRLFTELKSEKNFKNQLAGYLLADFMIYLIRTQTPLGTKNYSPTITEDAVLVYGIQDYINENVGAIKNIYELEEVFNYNYRHLAKVFYSITEKTPGDYLMECKMTEANRMLGENYTVTEISERLNYSSIHSFSRGYKNYYGISPTEYKFKLQKRNAKKDG